jgi:hypothetical protein
MDSRGIMLQEEQLGGRDVNGSWQMRFVGNTQWPELELGN